MNRVDFSWAWGRPVMGGPTALATRLRSYGRERVPRSGGLVIAFNHFSWIDIPAFGWSSPRTLYFLAKAEEGDGKCCRPQPKCRRGAALDRL